MLKTRQTDTELLVLDSVTGPFYESVTEKQNLGLLTFTAQGLETPFLELWEAMARLVPA